MEHTGLTGRGGGTPWLFRLHG